VIYSLRMSPTPRQFGKKLRTLREDAGMSQAALAKQAGITREYLNRLEAGQHDPTLGLVQRLARVLGVTWTAFDAGKGGG
jgi:transcriptional regulator with XRE-family HTH domain